MAQEAKTQEDRVSTIRTAGKRVTKPAEETKEENIETKISPVADLLCLLSATKARSLVVQLLHATPVTLKMEDTLSIALQTLIEANLTSAPVLGPNDSYVGFIDIGSLLSYIVHISSVDTSQLNMSKNKVFQSTLVSQVMGLAPPGIPFESSLHLALEIMATTGLHRIAVVNYFNNVCSVVTQSMLLQWLHEHIAALPRSMLEAKVGEVRKKAFVMYVREDDTLLSSFRLMQRKGVHALAIVDEKDNLIDCVSVHDVQVLGSKSVSFRMLWDTVKDIKIAGKKFPHLQAQMQTLGKTATFQQALELMVEAKTVRVFVVEDDGKKKRLLNMITATDILRYVLRFLSQGASLTVEGEETAEVPFTENYYVYAPFGDALMPASQLEVVTPATSVPPKKEETSTTTVSKVDAAHDPTYIQERQMREKQKLIEKQQKQQKQQQAKPVTSGRAGFQLLTPLAMPTPPPPFAPEETAPATSMKVPPSTPQPVPTKKPEQTEEKKEIRTAPVFTPTPNDTPLESEPVLPAPKTKQVPKIQQQQQQQQRRQKYGRPPSYNNSHRQQPVHNSYRQQSMRWKKISD